jgi:hypothetical protein
VVVRESQYGAGNLLRITHVGERPGDAFSEHPGHRAALTPADHERALD